LKIFRIWAQKSSAEPGRANTEHVTEISIKTKKERSATPTARLIRESNHSVLHLSKTAPLSLDMNIVSVILFYEETFLSKLTCVEQIRLLFFILWLYCAQKCGQRSGNHFPAAAGQDSFFSGTKPPCITN